MLKEPPKTKTCKVCCSEKDISNFYVRYRKDRDILEISAKCKECFALTRKRNEDYSKFYYSKNKNKIKENGKIYRENNKDIIKVRKKNYYDNNQKEINAKLSLKYTVDSEYRARKREREKNRYAKDPDKVKARVKKYQADNKETYNKKLSIRRKTNPNIGIRHRISVAIRRQLKNQGSSKNRKSILDYLEYSMEELKNHLEKQFVFWMNWKNRGNYDPKTWNDNDPTTWTWQVDHIIPQSDLPYTSMKDENFQKCWALSNLRPLSAKQNILEGSSLKRHK
jgi:hypothetical protein